MKVIIIKDCKDGKVDQVIDVAAGYATNFLIRNGFALPLNVKTSKHLNDNIKIKQDNAKKKLDAALKAKAFIENMSLAFSLKVTPDDVVHGSITRKQILKQLKEKGVNLDNHAVENLKIDTVGLTTLKITLHKEVIASLKVEVSKND